VAASIGLTHHCSSLLQRFKPLRAYPKSELRRVETTDKHFGTQMKIVVQSEVKGFFG
jgi:hypothetical protein